jgi:hypothetical protein
MAKLRTLPAIFLESSTIISRGQKSMPRLKSYHDDLNGLKYLETPCVSRDKKAVSNQRKLSKQTASSLCQRNVLVRTPSNRGPKKSD